MHTSYLKKLVALMEQLRNKEHGCSWDLAQSHKSLSKYMIEEAYEVAEAVKKGDKAEMKDELGDLLFQIIFHAQIAKEAGLFDLEEIAEGSYNKMIARHPHIFGAEADSGNRVQALKGWEAIKATERNRKRKEKDRTGQPGLLDGIARALPALLRSSKILGRLDNSNISLLLASEIRTIIDRLTTPDSSKSAEKYPASAQLSAEKQCGELLFACASLVSQYGVDPETALRSYNEDFEKRFLQLEEGQKIQDLDSNCPRSRKTLEYLYYGTMNEQKSD